MKNFRIFATRPEDCLYAILSLIILFYAEGISAFSFGIWIGVLLSSLIISTLFLRLRVMELLKRPSTRIYSAYFSCMIVWMAVAIILKWGWGWALSSGLLIYLAVEIPSMVFLIKFMDKKVFSTLKAAWKNYDAYTKLILPWKTLFSQAKK